MQKFAESKRLGRCLLFVIILLLMSASVVFGPSLAGAEQAYLGPESHISVLMGMKFMDDDWDPIDQQIAAGVDLDYASGYWPVSLCASIFYSTADDSLAGGDIKGSILEFHAGVRKIWFLREDLAPHVGAGVAVSMASMDASGGDTIDEKDDDIGYGFWIGAGIYYKLVQSWHIGIDVRYSMVNVDLAGSEVNAGGLYTSFVLGYDWESF